MSSLSPSPQPTPIAVIGRSATRDVGGQDVDAGSSGRGRRRTVGTLALLGVAAVIAAGCGASAASAPPATAGASSSSVTTAASASPATSVAPATAATVTAKLTEFHISLSRTDLAAGRYTFVMTNSGHTVHSLTIEGKGVDATLPSDLQPGQSGRLTVTLAAGKYDVFCPVGDHKELGMNLELTVGA